MRCSWTTSWDSSTRMIRGNELAQSLDKDDKLLPLQGALQMLDSAAIDGLFMSDKSEDGKDQTDSDCTAVETQSVASSLNSPQNIREILNVRSRDAIRRSTYRQKQKAHRDALYKQVDELSAQLTTLLKNKETAKAREGVGLVKTAVWKALTNRNLQARLNAEEQHRRLHKAIERRSALIRDLGVIIRKRISEEPLEDTGHSAKKPRTESPDIALYEAYISELDEVYAKTDSIFEETTVQTDDESGDEVRLVYNSVRPGGKAPSYHELVGAFSTPFPFDRVREHLGKACCMENHPGYELIEGPWIPECTTITKARIQAPGGNWLVQHSILGRYNEDDRIVLVWRKFTEGEGIFAGMHSDETGWCIIRPSPSCIKGSSGTLMESVIRFVPINISSATTSIAVVNQFADMLIKSGEDICQMGMQTLEEMLLDDALGVY